MRRSRGFSLLEISVVLGVAGLLISGVWAVASSMRETAQIEQLKVQNTQIVKNIQSYHSTRAFPTTASYFGSRAAFRAQMDAYKAIGAFPEELCNQTCVGASTENIESSVGGTLAVGTYSAPSNTPSDVVQKIAVSYSGLNSKSCIGFLSDAALNKAAANGLVAVYVTKITAATPATHSGDQINALPTTQSQVITSCTSNLSAGTTISLDLIYQMRL